MNNIETIQIFSRNIECPWLLLAATNHVFKTMFYGLSPDQGETVVVQVFLTILGSVKKGCFGVNRKP